MFSLHQVCCIMDLDGFDIRVSKNGGLSYHNKFLVRELGYIQIDPELEFRPISFRFDLSKEIDLNKISDNVLQTLRYQSQKVMGLSVMPGRNEVTKNYGDLNCIVRDMYQTCRRPGLDVVAYKGGCKEKELLESLGIPSLDLGLFGCKTYLKLVKEKDVYSTLLDCGNHFRSRVPFHCPMAETIAFRDWYMRNYKLCMSPVSVGDSSDEDSF